MRDAASTSRYSIQLTPLPEEMGGGYQALFPSLAHGVVGYGATPQEALDHLFDAVPDFLEAVEEMGQSLPVIEGQADPHREQRRAR